MSASGTYPTSLVSGKVICGGQQTLSIQCRGGNLSGKRFELRAAEDWAGAPLPHFSTMRDARLSPNTVHLITFWWYSVLGAKASPRGHLMNVTIVGSTSHAPRAHRAAPHAFSLVSSCW